MQLNALKKINFIRILSDIVIFTLCSSIIYLLISFIIEHDLSMQTPVDTKSLGKLSGQKIWLISYADGKDIHIQNQNFLAYSALNKGIDIVINYRKEHIDRSFYKQHEFILKQPRGAGYWLWKPYFILKTLNSIPENDILMYVDSGWTMSKGTMQDIIPKVNNHDMVIISRIVRLKGLIKRDTVVKMGMDGVDLNKEQIGGSVIIMKNVEPIRKFVQEWLFYAEDPEILTDLPSKNKEYQDFRDHRHDQSILNLLYYKYKNNFYPYPILDAFNIFQRHHRREKNDKHSIGSSIDSKTSLFLWQYTEKLNKKSRFQKAKRLTTRYIIEKIRSIYNLSSSLLSSTF